MEPAPRSNWKHVVHGLLVTVIGAGLTLACFLLLPLLRAMTSGPKADLMLRDATTTELPPPPPPVEEQEPDEPEDEPPPPEAAPDAPPLDLAQLEMALDPGAGWGMGGVGDFVLPMGALGGQLGGDMDSLFDFGGLEEKPQPIYRARPQVTRVMRKRMPATVNILLTVNEQGQVETPVVQSSDDPIFEAPALEAIRQWRFEPGKRNGRPDSFRVRQPITFR